MLHDPDKLTFADADLDYFINAGIAQVSRSSPQKFREDIPLIPGTLSYAVKGGTGNLVANPSFEEGDDTVQSGWTSVGTSDSELLGGWTPSATQSVYFLTSSNAQTGQRIGLIKLPASTSTKSLLQDIPVNPGSTYYCSGFHWKGTAGGEGNVVQFHTLDDSSVVVDTDAVRHDTTAAVPTSFSGSITIPDDGSVAFIRVVLTAYSAGAWASDQLYAFEDISVTEENSSLIATNALDSVEIVRVEVWSTDYDPPQKVGIISRGRGDSESGWEWWDGRLNIPYRWLGSLNTAIHYLRVWGYAPYSKLTAATQVTDLSFELEQAVMEYAGLQALEKLNRERELFSQWQTRTGNTDMSPAGLMSALAQARENWRRTKRDILVLREHS